MFRFAVCDDENAVCTALERDIASACNALRAEADIDVFGSGEALIKYLGGSESYHMMFIDIELGQCSGIDVARYVRETLHDDVTQIVFVTGKYGYDRQLFDFRPFSFVAKPFAVGKITAVLEKYFRIYRYQDELFHYKYGHDTYWVRLRDVLYFKSNDRKALIRKQDSWEEFYGALRDVQEQIGERGFFSPHKSYLVNYRYIRIFRSDAVVMANGDVIPVAKGKREEVARMQLVFENGYLYGHLSDHKYM